MIEHPQDCNEQQSTKLMEENSSAPSNEASIEYYFKSVIQAPDCTLPEVCTVPNIPSFTHSSPKYFNRTHNNGDDVDVYERP